MPGPVPRAEAEESRDEAAEQPVIEQPAVDLEQLRETARTAVTALREFILTGNQERRQEFQRLWDENPSADFTRMVSEEFTTRIMQDRGTALDDVIRAYRQISRQIDPIELAEAVSVCYEELRRPRAERNNERLARYGDAFIGAMSRLVVGVAVPIRVEQQDIDHFVSLFSVEVPSGSTREQTMSAITNAVRVRLHIDTVANAETVTQALLHAYVATESEQRASFDSWVGQLDEAQSRSLVRAVTAAGRSRGRLPYTVVQSAFSAWRTQRMQARERLSDEERALARFPRFIREGTLRRLYTNFQDNPSDYNIENISRRLEYITRMRAIHERRGQQAEIRAIDAEIRELGGSLRRLGITAENPAEGLRTMRAGLMVIQTGYYSMSESDMTLIEYLEANSSNRTLLSIYSRYLARLDARTANIFENLDPDSRTFITQARREIRRRISSADARRGQGIWTTEYMRSATVEESEREETTATGETRTIREPSPSEAELQMLDRIARLGPLSSVTFLRYVETVRDNNLSSDDERQLVVDTVARLGAISQEVGMGTSRLLIAKYFAAITNLADICYDNPDAFRQALLVISARIEAETDSILRGASPTQILALNVRYMVENLDRALGNIAELSRSELAQYDRLNLWDDTLEMRSGPPPVVRQRAPGYAPRLGVDSELARSLAPPYFLPDYLYSYGTRTGFTSGGTFTSPPSYGGELQMPGGLRSFDVATSTRIVGQTFDAYLGPEHTVVPIGRDIPGIAITSLSPTRLLGEIQAAFVPSERPEYSFEPVGGGLQAGVRGREVSDEWEIEGAGLGSLITPTGGLALGGSGSESGRIFAGASAVRVPVGFVRHIPIVGGGYEVTGIDSAVGGYERLSSQEEEQIVRLISTQWADENNARQTLIVLNREEDADDMSYMTARLLMVDRDGSITELVGGTNDFVDALNFFAGYANEQFGTPTTYTFNAEPTVERGGGALAIDLSQVPIVFHGQRVPFLGASETAPAPDLVEWTLGIAGTAREGGRTDVHQVTFPGRMLRLMPGEEGEQRYWMQDVTYMLRRVTGRTDAWELRLGAGAGQTPTSWMGRGGAFFRFQRSRYRAGGGAYYEAGSTEMDALALLNDAERERQYVESLHRIGAQIYGSGEVANRLVLGALAHAVVQLREQSDTSLEFDNVFYRFVGLMRGLESVGTRMRWGARIGASRISRLDQMLAGYEQLGRDIGRDPRHAEQYITQFRERYVEDVQRIFNNYSLGIQIRNDFSLEATFVTREDEDGWVGQTPDTAQGRVLYTWRSGFWRAFSSIPLGSRYGIQEGEGRPGIVGTGVGFDMLRGFFLQRAAMDVGILLARHDEEGDWELEGWMAQAGVRVFSNVLQDSVEYRRLAQDYRDYLDAIRAGRFSEIPRAVRDRMLEELPPSAPPNLRERLRLGRRVEVSEAQATALEDLLYDTWYYDERYELERRFNGHMRVLLGGSVYHFSDRIYWDIATFVEHVDHFRGYLIAAQREELGIYAGAELDVGRVRSGAVVGASESGVSAAASMSLGFRAGDLPLRIGITGFGRTDSIPTYAAPMHPPMLRHGVPEFGGIIFLSLGEQGPLPLTGQQPTRDFGRTR